MGTSGSVSFLFEHKCVFKIAQKEGLDIESLELELIDCGVDEVFNDESEIVIYAPFEAYGTIQKYLEDHNIEIISGEFERIPLDTKEVVARIKAVLRRCHCAESGDKNVIQFENLSLDMSQYQLKVKGKIVEAPPKELELLAYLAGHPNRVFTRDQLLDEVWGFEYYGDSRTIDVHIKRLREKLEGASEKWSLKTVWGVGYKFEVKD